MIQQHLLQQQRLNYNFDRLLERQNRLIQPKVSEFRPFGTSSLPGRNYDEHLNKIHKNNPRRDSLVAQSRRNIGSSSETYRLMGGGTSEILPRNINSVMQHTRNHSLPLVHAERFVPVKVYDHPVFGPTPAYLRPIFHDRNHLEDNYSDKESSESENDDNHVQPSSATNFSSKNEYKEQTEPSSTTGQKHDHDHNHDDESNYAPLGYISYKKWKEKYANIIPVNPLLYNIYTHRSNGSIDSYGQSLYSSPNRPRQLSGEEDLLTTTLSDLGSDTSEIPRGTSSSSHQRYHRLQPQIHSKTPIPRSLPPLHTADDSDLSDVESSPPDSPVPYLSRNKQNPFSSTRLPSITTPSTPVITPSVPTTVTSSTLNTSGINTAGTSSRPTVASTTTSTISPATPISSSSSSSINTSNIPLAPPLPRSTSTPTSSIPPAPPLPTSTSTATSSIPLAPPLPTSTSTTTSSIPPAPPFPKSISTTTSSIPPAPPFPTSVSTTTSTIPSAPPLPSSTSSTNISNNPTASSSLSGITSSNIPPAPPMPASLSTTSSTINNTYAKPSSLPISSPPIAPPMPSSLTSSTPSTTYQAPSSISVAPPTAPLLAGSTTKAVTFGGLSSIPATNNNDISSSSDSDDSEKQKRQRQRKRQAAAAAGVYVDDSSSDD